MHQMALTLDHARDRGALGMERAAARANRVHVRWTELALNALLLHVRTLPADAEFIVEDIRLAVEPQIPVPPDGRAWGMVTRLAMNRGYIEPTEHYGPAKSSNASAKPRYVKGRAA